MAMVPVVWRKIFLEKYNIAGSVLSSSCHTAVFILIGHFTHGLFMHLFGSILTGPAMCRRAEIEIATLRALVERLHTLACTHSP